MGEYGDYQARRIEELGEGEAMADAVGLKYKQAGEFLEDTARQEGEQVKAGVTQSVATSFFTTIVGFLV